MSVSKAKTLIRILPKKEKKKELLLAAALMTDFYPISLANREKKICRTFARCCSTTQRFSRKLVMQHRTNGTETKSPGLF